MKTRPDGPAGRELDRLLPWGPPPRLVLRFALYTGLGIAIAAAAILLFVRHFERGRAERAATAHTRLVAQLLSDRLHQEDFQRPSGRARRAQLDALFDAAVLRQGVVRVELVDQHGVVAYSSDHTLIGQRDPDARFFLGAPPDTVVSRVTAIDPPGPRREHDAFRAFAPLRLDDGHTGTLALAQDHAPIVAAAQRAFLPVVGVLELVLLGLYILLFPILTRVTKRMRRQMDVIEHQALHDALTGLPNRTLFQARLEETLAAGAGDHLAVLLLDFDRFKEINDTLGHSNGDALLRALAARLELASDGCVALARLGGDEFGVIAQVTDSAASLELAERLRRSLAEPTEIAGVSLEVQASVGVALAPDHGIDTETLLRCADVAMYSSKVSHAPRLYAAEHDTHSAVRLALAGELRRGLDDGELVAYYQPQLDLRTGVVRGVEALVRWRHPTRGFLAPAEFLSVAEQSGLMRRLTRTVLEQSLAQCRAWHNAGLDLTVAVNISDRDLVDSRFADEVGRLLAEHGVDPSLLELEITEGTIVADSTRTHPILERLSALGARIAVDDFGTGYSSLGQLKRLPVNLLKIDRSFVVNMTTEKSDAAIVRSTIELAHSLGIDVVAEGVESEAVSRRLAALGCDSAQGYWISRPLPADDLTAWLEANRGTPWATHPAAPVHRLRADLSPFEDESSEPIRRRA
jgi:diguanylate cyclase (GGDEF)-like protein